MKFSCLTLSFNQGMYLQEAISSIKSQNIDFEYLIYDPGSWDVSRALARSNIDKSTNVYFVDGDQGPADGLNNGLKKLNGDIFYYLNADDTVKPNAFIYVRDYFINHPECDVLHGSIEIINEHGVFLRTLPAMKFTLLGYALGYSVVYQQATFIRMRVLGENPFNTQNKISWDGELIVDLALAGAVIHQTQKVLGKFRIHSDSITGSGKFRNLAINEHSRIAREILGHEILPWEKLFGATIRYSRAARRRFFPRYY
jgi:glycosyltransferase involved in cell wall biosynthesis